MAISKHDKQGLADLFIAMGVPLVIAMQTVEGWTEGASEPLEKKAQTLSKLLTVSVEFATKMTKKLDIRDSYTLENVRGKIIKIVTPIVADRFVTTGQIPDLEGLSEIVNLFDVVISFSETVSPTDDKELKQSKMASMINASEPLIAAIRDNNFNQDETKLFNDSVSSVMGRAKQLSKSYGMDGETVENGLFQAVLKLYVSSYKQIATSGESYEAIWAECDARIALLYGLTVFVGEKTGSVISIEKQDAKKNPEELQNSDKDDILPVKKTKKTTKTEKSSNDDDDDDFNPMAFFSAEK